MKDWLVEDVALTPDCAGRKQLLLHRPFVSCSSRSSALHTLYIFNTSVEKLASAVLEALEAIADITTYVLIGGFKAQLGHVRTRGWGKKAFAGRLTQSSTVKMKHFARSLYGKTSIRDVARHLRLKHCTLAPHNLVGQSLRPMIIAPSNPPTKTLLHH